MMSNSLKFLQTWLISDDQKDEHCSTALQDEKKNRNIKYIKFKNNKKSYKCEIYIYIIFEHSSCIEDVNFVCDNNIVKEIIFFLERFWHFTNFTSQVWKLMSKLFIAKKKMSKLFIMVITVRPLKK